MISIIPDPLARLFLRTKGWHCPNCDAREKVAKFPRPCAEMIFRCAHCDWAGSLGQTIATKMTSQNPENQPRDFVETDPELMEDLEGQTSKIIKTDFPDDKVTFEVPASGKSGGLLIFSIFWLGFMTIFSGILIFTAFNGGENETPPAVFFLFVIPFWLFGLWMLRQALVNKFEKSIFVAENGKLIWLRKFGRKSKKKEMAFVDLTWVKVLSFYQVNDQNVYGVEVKGKSEKWRLGVGLEPDEKNWLAAELRRACGLRSEEEILAEETTGEVLADLPREGWRWEHKAKRLWFIALFGLIFFGVGAGIFYSQVINSIRDFSGESSIFSVVFNLAFILIPGIISLVFMGVGGFFVFFGLSTGNRGTELRIYSDRVVLRKRKKHSVDETTLRREQIREFNAYHSGSVNADQRYAMEILANERIYPIASWVPFDEIHAVQARMNAFLAGK